MRDYLIAYIACIFLGVCVMAAAYLLYSFAVWDFKIHAEHFWAWYRGIFMVWAFASLFIAHQIEVEQGEDERARRAMLETLGARRNIQRDYAGMAEAVDAGELQISKGTSAGSIPAACTIEDKPRKLRLDD